jgi:hypothetical protein
MLHILLQHMTKKYAGGEFSSLNSLKLQLHCAKNLDISDPSDQKPCNALVILYSKRAENEREDGVSMC